MLTSPTCPQHLPDFHLASTLRVMVIRHQLPIICKVLNSANLSRRHFLPTIGWEPQCNLILPLLQLFFSLLPENSICCPRSGGLQLLQKVFASLISSFVIHSKIQKQAFKIWLSDSWYFAVFQQTVPGSASPTPARPVQQ